MVRVRVVKVWGRDACRGILWNQMLICQKTANLMMTFSYKHVYMCQNIKRVDSAHSVNY